MTITAGRTLRRTCELSGRHRRWKFRPRHHSGPAETGFIQNRSSIIWTSWTTTEKTTTTTSSNIPAFGSSSEEFSLWKSWQVNLPRTWDYTPRTSIRDISLPTTPMATTFRESQAWTRTTVPSLHTDSEMSSCRSGEGRHSRPGARPKCTCRTCRRLPWIIVRPSAVTRPPLRVQVDPTVRTWMFFFSSNINQVVRTNRWLRLNLWVFWIQLLRGINLTQLCYVSSIFCL